LDAHARITRVFGDDAAMASPPHAASRAASATAIAGDGIRNDSLRSITTSRC
jgi:hypothetical protein